MHTYVRIHACINHAYIRPHTCMHQSCIHTSAYMHAYTDAYIHACRCNKLGLLSSKTRHGTACVCSPRCLKSCQKCCSFSRLRVRMQPQTALHRACIACYDCQQSVLRSSIKSAASQHSGAAPVFNIFLFKVEVCVCAPPIHAIPHCLTIKMPAPHLSILQLCCTHVCHDLVVTVKLHKDFMQSLCSTLLDYDSSNTAATIESYICV
jgi:hypothetical protein